MKLARIIKRLPMLLPPITYEGVDEEHMEEFFEDLYEELPYLKDAPKDEVLALYKAGMLNVWEDTDGEW